ncbi:hypothetical protein M0802_009679 [Mischocyttarus mexicanus]|nr:hypothetical protein M0802_009679 [Mischocyttarus mexicanus]
MPLRFKLMPKLNDPPPPPPPLPPPRAYELAQENRLLSILSKTALNIAFGEDSGGKGVRGGEWDGVWGGSLSVDNVETSEVEKDPGKGGKSARGRKRLCYQRKSLEKKVILVVLVVVLVVEDRWLGWVFVFLSLLSSTILRKHRTAVTWEPFQVSSGFRTGIDGNAVRFSGHVQCQQ